MAALKYSRQRASIKEYLMNTKEHPTADTIYFHIKEHFPHISLGTVYRNLNLLSDMGEILKIATPNGGVRFDGYTAPHYHFVCSSCGAVFDLDLDEKSFHDINKLATQHFDGSIDSHTTLFSGTCKKCLAEKNNTIEKEKITVSD